MCQATLGTHTTPLTPRQLRHTDATLTRQAPLSLSLSVYNRGPHQAQAPTNTHDRRTAPEDAGCECNSKALRPRVVDTTRTHRVPHHAAMHGARSCVHAVHACVAPERRTNSPQTIERDHARAPLRTPAAQTKTTRSHMHHTNLRDLLRYTSHRWIILERMRSDQQRLGAEV